MTMFPPQPPGPPAPPPPPPPPADRQTPSASAGSSGTYRCPYCRMESHEIDMACPHCGAPVDIREHVSDSGWAEQPGIRDMARIQFGRSTCQISGSYVPVADMGLAESDWIYFSHHVLLYTAPTVQLDALQMAK